eukprot:maker-scaffold_4-snap-gene-17.49-mRNA-1 protein AED:0.05 eAED:0.07 QI:0/0/0/1/0.5/0.33/3/0/417
MGVNGLWELLAPASRRVDIQTLHGKVLAVDISIWLIQFIYGRFRSLYIVLAMKERESGEIVRSAHILGTLRRILKLISHQIKPVFVFDGSVPALKKETIRRRRQLRQKQEKLIKATAEKLKNLKEQAAENRKKLRSLESSQFQVTKTMIDEVKRLITLFGFPFIEAPMEAEAQCALLEKMNYVDGVITNDSDVFLFGAENVYKNIFMDKKFVEAYKMRDIEKKLRLNREKIILLALLLGSDYTEGVKNIGIVNGTEIVQEYPTLEEFGQLKKWVESVSVRQRNTKASASRKEFWLKHKNVKKSWVLPEGFPSRRVVDAYENPEVLAEEEVGKKLKKKGAKFWQKPKEDKLNSFLSRKLGLTPHTIQKILEEPLRAYNAVSAQRTIDSYFISYEDNVEVARIRSKRLKKAMKLEDGQT